MEAGPYEFSYRVKHMENRFGVKDFFLFSLLAFIVVLVGLEMWRADRQWEQLQQTTNLLQEQTRDLSRIRRLLEEGVTFTPREGGTAATNVSGTSVTQQAAASTQPASLGTTEMSTDDRVKRAQQLPGYATGDFYVDMFASPPEKLTPIISSDTYSSSIQGQVLESLADRDPQTLKWRPNIARGWTVSPDGLEMTFTMKRGVTFSDGEPLTADDVIYTYQLIMNDKIDAPRQRVYYEKVKTAEKVNDYEVRFTFKETYFQNFEVIAGLGIMPEHFYSKFTPEEFNRSTGLLLGSGPYRLADPTTWRNEPGKPVELVRNERYWGEPAPFDKLIWRIVQNESARMTTFQNGDVDEFSPSPEQYVSLLKDEKLLARTQHFEFDSPSGGYLFVGWNQKRQDKPTPFADRRVRQAMTMLIDRQAICEQIMLGYAKVATGPFNPLGNQVDKSIQPWPFDPTAAKKLLAEAGYVDRNNDGVVDGPDGQPLRFAISYPSSSETYNRTVLLMKDTFARGGVICEPKPTEWSVLLQDMDARNFDAISLGWGGSIEGDLYQIFHSSQAIAGGDNVIGYVNPELDKAIEAARTTADESKRSELWQACHRIMHEDQPYTFLYTRKALAFMDGRIKNVQRVSLGLNPMLEWYVPKDLRKWAP
jgi:peptide/nickel transport system substrate-binding protein